MPTTKVHDQKTYLDDVPHQMKKLRNGIAFCKFEMCLLALALVVDSVEKDHWLPVALREQVAQPFHEKAGCS